MDSTTAIAITGIIVSGVVGPGFAAWWARQRQRRDLIQQRQAMLSEVLDESARVLGVARQAFERVHVLETSGVPPASEESKQAGQSWRASLTEVRYCQDRLAIRVGEGHPVHVAFGECVGNLERRRALAWSYEQGIDTTKARLVEEEAHRSFNNLRSTYLAACKALLEHNTGAASRFGHRPGPDERLR